MRSIDSNDKEDHETSVTLNAQRKKNKKKWYAREDLNLHVLGHQNLNLARLPIPPLAHVGSKIKRGSPGLARLSLDGDPQRVLLLRFVEPRSQPLTGRFHCLTFALGVILHLIVA